MAGVEEKLGQLEAELRQIQQGAAAMNGQLQGFDGRISGVLTALDSKPSTVTFVSTVFGSVLGGMALVVTAAGIFASAWIGSEFDDLKSRMRALLTIEQMVQEIPKNLASIQTGLDNLTQRYGETTKKTDETSTAVATLNANEVFRKKVQGILFSTGVMGATYGNTYFIPTSQLSLLTPEDKQRIVYQMETFATVVPTPITKEHISRLGDDLPARFANGLLVVPK